MSKSEIAFVVMRVAKETGRETPIGIFEDYQTAQDNADAWGQQFIDKGITEFEFYVAATAWYND